MINYYDRQGNKITVDEFEQLLIKDNGSYKIIKQEALGDFFISTIWLGLNYSLFSGLPVIFETVVFDNKIGQFDSVFDMERYCTEEAALEGHQEKVREMQEYIKKQNHPIPD